MDNLTHALAGVAVAQAALARHAEPERTRLWTPFHVAAIVASNAPDLDIAYTAITGGTLGYLLHHRGHTHTIPIAAVLGLLFAAPAVWRARRSGRPLSRAATMSLFLVVLVCSWLHLAMDFTNSYGVHPWWPLDRRWIYGDLVFIIEPLLFCVLAIPLGFMARHRVTRVLIAVVTLAVVALPWVLPLPRASGWVVLVFASGWLLCWARLAPRGSSLDGRRLLVLVGGLAGFYALSVATHRQALTTYADALGPSVAAAGETVLDVIAPPSPATPWCRDLIVVSVTQDRFVLRSGRMSLLPAWTPADRCPKVRERSTAPLVTELAGDGSKRAHLDGRIDLPRETLDALARDCRAAAFLRFARAPFWVPATQTLGDLRFDRDEGMDFAEVSLALDAACPRFVPDWVPPRQDAIDAP